MTTFYRHGSQRLSDKKIFTAVVEEFIPSVFKLDTVYNQEIYGVYLPNGCTLLAYASVKEALDSVAVNLLQTGWTINREQAARRARKEVELRTSGRMRFAGPKYNHAEFKA